MHEYTYTSCSEELRSHTHKDIDTHQITIFSTRPKQKDKKQYAGVAFFIIYIYTYIYMNTNINLHMYTYTNIHIHHVQENSGHTYTDIDTHQITIFSTRPKQKDKKL